MAKRTVSISGQETGVEVSADVATGGERTVRLISRNAVEATVEINGERHVVPYVVSADVISFALRGEIYSAEVSSGAARSRRKHKEHSMSAPMPGVVLRILTENGATVAKGAPLMILEAMKMEHQIVAPYDGIVRSIACAQGDLVQPGVDLIVIDPIVAEPK